MDQRRRFIGDYYRQFVTFSELCARYGVSRRIGYKWLARYEVDGPPGLGDRSRRPHRSPAATPLPVVEQVLALRRSHPSWGAKKLLSVLARRGVTALPGRSACCDLLKRHGLVVSPRRRKYPGHPGRPLSRMREPNAVWTADFKGQFKTGDGKYCYPLTVADGYSRLLLACQALRSTALELARPVFYRLFQEFGLPEVIRTDNGVPFATTALGRLSALSVWWIRLGIFPELIEPAHPQQNGSHERMHRTLKRETIRPPKRTLAAQQVCFNRFRREYNEERPHEALGQTTPASRYHPSPRVLPKVLPDIAYPAHYEVRYVSLTAAFAGSASGSATASGTSTSGRFNSEEWTSVSYDSRTTADVGSEDKCYPCLRTECYLSLRPLSACAAYPCVTDVASTDAEPRPAPSEGQC